MSTIYRMADHEEWAEMGLGEPPMDCAEYCNQIELGDGTYEGDWYTYEDGLRVYYGTFGDNHAPGSSHYTYAEVAEDEKELQEILQRWEAMPEYIEEEESEKEEEDLEKSEYIDMED